MQEPTTPSAGARRDVQSSAVCADASRHVQECAGPIPAKDAPSTSCPFVHRKCTSCRDSTNPVPPTYLQHQRRAPHRSRARSARPPPQGVDGRGGRCSNRRRSAAKRIATERRLDRPLLRCIGQYDPRVVAPQTETVKLNADLVERAQREADKRGITLKQFVDNALKRWLANEEQALHRQSRVGLGQSVDGLSAAETASEPAARPTHRGK